MDVLHIRIYLQPQPFKPIDCLSGWSIHEVSLQNRAGKLYVWILQISTKATDHERQHCLRWSL